MSENRNDHYNSPKPQIQYVFCFHKVRRKAAFSVFIAADSFSVDSSVKSLSCQL